MPLVFFRAFEGLSEAAVIFGIRCRSVKTPFLCPNLVCFLHVKAPASLFCLCLFFLWLIELLLILFFLTDLGVCS
jgi:hypothetical protein